MSTFNITFDTETKQMSVKMNGTDLPDVNYVHLCRYKKYEPEENEEEYYSDICVEMANEEDGVMMRKVMTANHKDSIPQEVKSGWAKQTPFDKTVYYIDNASRLIEGASKMLQGS